MLFSDDGYSMARRGCQVAGETGTCMFVWECLKTEGKHLGMCMDGFMFGSCCVHNQENNVVLDSISDSMESLDSIQDSTTESIKTTTSHVTTSGRPTRPSRPTKPTHSPIKWPNFHLIDNKNDKEDKDKDGVKQSHFVSIKAPQDPRPNLTTK